MNVPALDTFVSAAYSIFSSSSSRMKADERSGAFMTTNDLCLLVLVLFMIETKTSKIQNTGKNYCCRRKYL